MKTLVIAAAGLGLTLTAASAQEARYGARLEGFEYPFKTESHDFSGQNQSLSMTFMDVAAAEPNGQTVVLLHGKNFCAATWEETIKTLTGAGYRVIAPDQVGFCKSSKPEHYQYSFHALAQNTKALLDARNIDRATVVGHSMGGMLATRFSLMYPEAVDRLVLVNPIGLEDWKAEGVPYQPIDEAFAGEKKTSFDSIKAYQEKVYYTAGWKPQYDRWVEMSAGMYAGEGGELVAWNQALTSDMVFTQPVVHEFDKLKVPTLLIIGTQDRTAPGANRAPEEIAARMGDYTKLGKAAAEAIPDAELVEFDNLGHSPQIEDPQRFHATLIEKLGAARQ